MRSTESAQLLAIRLQALEDSPSAFGTTLAETEALSTHHWEERAAISAAGNVRIIFVAEDEGTWVGLAGGMLEPEANASSVTLVSMWVNPAYRRKRLGRELVRHVVEWSRLRAVTRVALWVTQNNTGAIALYTDCGFRMTKDTQPLPSNPTLLERRMVLDLTS